jgi:Zn-dependent M28 family amino/carboxypeptidase
MPWVAQREPAGWKATHRSSADSDHLGFEPLSDDGEEVTVDARKRAWARFLAKVYEVDPFVCPRMQGRAAAEGCD